MAPVHAEPLTKYLRTDVITYEGETRSEAPQARNVSTMTGGQDPLKFWTMEVFRGGTLAATLEPRAATSEEDGAEDEEDAVGGSAVDEILGGLADWPRAVEMRWIEEHAVELKQFAGEWVVVEGERLIAHGNKLPEVVNKAKSLGIKVPYVVRIPEEQEAPFIG